MIRVAIDGPAGVGKSSTSKALAKYFGYAYLDTGAMYRACAWWCLKQDIDLDAETVDERVITEAVGEFFTGDHFDISVDPDNPRVFADDEDISEAIRSSEVSSHVSKVSNVIPVRNVLIAAQPTRGVDVGAQELIHSRLLDLRDAGKAVLLISADLDEVRRLSDRIAVIYEGKIVAQGSYDTWNEMELGLLMAGEKAEKEARP